MNIRTLKVIPHSIWFNFKYLPFHQAIKLPILVGYGLSVKIAQRKGSIIINGPIKTGMIQMAVSYGSFDQGKGANSFLRMAKGAKMYFNGRCKLAKGFVSCINEKGSITFGKGIHLNAYSIVNSSASITLGDGVRTGWHCTIIDSDGHDVLNVNDGTVLNPARPINIGEHSWLAAHTTILKGVTLEHHTIVPYGSIITKSNSVPFAIFGGKSNKVLKEGVIRGDKYKILMNVSSTKNS